MGIANPTANLAARSINFGCIDAYVGVFGAIPKMRLAAAVIYQGARLDVPQILFPCPLRYFIGDPYVVGAVDRYRLALL